MSQPSGQLVKVSEKVSKVGAWLQAPGFVDQLRLALPQAGITAERLARIAFTEVRRNPKLADCSIESLMGATMACAMYGLEPGPMGFCFIIPYRKEASFQVGFKGLLQLAWKSEMIDSVQVAAVYDGDGFTFRRGVPLVLEHEPSIDPPDDESDYQQVYAVVSVRGGGHIVESKTRAQIWKHRDQYSQAYRGAEKYKKYDSPWHTNELAMAKKTVLIQALKLAPMSTQLASLIAGEGRAAIGLSPDYAVDVTVPASTEAQIPEESSAADVVVPQSDHPEAETIECELCGGSGRDPEIPGDICGACGGQGRTLV